MTEVSPPTRAAMSPDMAAASRTMSEMTTAHAILSPSLRSLGRRWGRRLQDLASALTPLMTVSRSLIASVTAAMSPLISLSTAITSSLPELTTANTSERQSESFFMGALFKSAVESATHANATKTTNFILLLFIYSTDFAFHSSYSKNLN